MSVGKIVAAATAAAAVWFTGGLSDRAVAQEQGIHLGVASCAGSTCHGAAEPFASSSVLQNEYVTWDKYDSHAKAYKVLLEDRSKRIAANLGLPNAHEADICLDCHATNVPAEKRGAQFQISDGVGCESCHGGGSGWLGIHISGGTHQANLDAGLIETENPIVRANMCLDCHFGNKDQFVTHRIMGAGHPRMGFELDTFTAVQPAHYAMDEDYFERKVVTDGFKTWAIGQALMLERRMDLLLDEAAGTEGMFPELVFYDCHACHHPMSDVRWRNRPGTGLGPGVPKFNDSPLLMLEVAMGVADSGLAAQTADVLREIHSASVTSRPALVAAAQKARGLARAAVQAIAAKEISAADMATAMRTVADRGAKGVYVDYESAEQATMAIGSILEAMKTAGFVDDGAYAAMSERLETAYAAVDNDEKYRAGTFAQAMRGYLSAIQ